jgi:hypothetical protein
MTPPKVARRTATPEAGFVRGLKASIRTRAFLWVHRFLSFGAVVQTSLCHKRCLIRCSDFMRKLTLLTLILAGSLGTAFSQTTLSTTEVDWFNSAATLLLNGSGVALTQGTTANNDGDWVQLGYFSAGTAANNFSGTWTPLTAAGGLPTTIGDSPDLSGLGNGRIGFSTTFHFGSNVVDVYDSLNDTGHYLTQSSQTIGASAPPSGQVLAIRFYDSTSTSGHYNTVSADTWQWVTPTDAGSFVVINLATSTLEWESVSVFGLTGTEFKTVLPIPEPSTYALLGLGAVGMIGLRRRLKR